MDPTDIPSSFCFLLLFIRACLKCEMKNAIAYTQWIFNTERFVCSYEVQSKDHSHFVLIKFYRLLLL